MRIIDNISVCCAMPTNQPEGLIRQIGVRSMTLNGINLTVGAGIFALPALVAGTLGSAAIFAYLICGILLGLVLLCFVEVGTKFSTTGGIYAYVEMAFGPYAGFLVNMLFVVFALSADAAVANILIENLVVIMPAFSGFFWKATLLILIFGGVITLNVIGLKHGLLWMEFITLAKVIPLMAFIIIGMFFIDGKNFEMPETLTFQQFGEASLILFFAFGGGVEGTFNTTGEIKNPTRTIPISVFLALLSVLIIYGLTQLVAQGILGNALKEQTAAPLAMVASHILGNAGTILMIIGAVVSCLGLISSDIMTSSRLPYAAGRDGLLPKFIGKVHPRYATPYWAIIVHGSLGLILSLTGGFKQLAVLSSSTILLVYVGVILATLKLRNIKVENSFKMPGGMLIPIIALGITAWFLSYLTIPEIIATLIFMGICSGFYFMNTYGKKFRKNSQN